MYLEELVYRFEKEIPGYNKYPFTYSQFEKLCAEEGILIKEEKLPCKGLLISHPATPPCIFLNRNLWPPGYKTYIGFHEYFHYRLHPGTIHFYFRSPLWHEKIENEADILAALAVIPTPCLVHDLLLGEDIAEKYGVPQELVRKRLRILEEYRNILRARGKELGVRT